MNPTSAVVQRNGHFPALAADELGGYRFGHVLEAVDPAVRRSPFAMDMLRVWLGTFVSSAGRQYAQLSDMAVLVALIQRRHYAGQLKHDIDWEFLLTNGSRQAVSRLPLPDAHTAAPNRVQGQVSGIYRFWWEAFVDVFEGRYFGLPMPSNDDLDDRMEYCGVPLYATTSSTGEELAAIHEAFAAYRNDPAWRTASPRSLVRHCVKAHLGKEIHHYTFPRHRRPTPDARRPDRHEPLLRRSIRAAMDTPAPRRTLYDELMVLLHDALDEIVLSVGIDPGVARLQRLHRRVVAAHNAHHPDAPITHLHR